MGYDYYESVGGPFTKYWARGDEEVGKEFQGEDD